MKRVACLATVGLVVLVACSRQPADEPIASQQPAQWQTVVPEEMTETQKAQHELGLAAVNALMSELMGELTAALDSGGTSEAIGVCREKAPAIAARVGEQFGLEIGRTSFALRNPGNKAPKWADGLVSDHVGTPTFLAGPGGELGALLPIRLRAECGMCHGPAETVAEEVQAAIAEHYPEDQAVNFAEGDLRGWFWFETPAGSEDPPTM